MAASNCFLNKDIVCQIKSVGLQKCTDWLFETAQQFCDSVSDNKKSYESLCRRVYKKYQSLLKKKSRKEGKLELEQYLSDEVNYPKPNDSPKVYSREKSENIKYLQDQSNSLKDISLNLAEELNTSLSENTILKHDLQEVIKTNSLKLSKVGNIKKLKSDLKQVRDVEKQGHKLNKYLKSRLLIKNMELKRLRLKLAYLGNTCNKKDAKLRDKDGEIENLKTDLDRSQHEHINQKTQFQEIMTQLRDIELENDWLQGMVNDTVITYNENARQYTSELQQCVYKLLNSNVSFSNISPVITSVLELAKCKANKLPSKATVNNMNVQRLALSQRQIADELSLEENLCLLSDETNKFGTKYEGMHVTDSKGTYWVLGVREMTTKAGKDILHSLLNILGDIDAVSRVSENPTSKAILKHIVSTMSDRASTQTKFNALLEDFRKDVLKEDLGQQWENMSYEEQLSVSQLCNFFCSLHALVHMADTSSKSLIEVEKAVFADAPILDKSFKNSNEPGSVRLVRTCCKAFSKGGDDKNGQYCNFSTYSKEFLQEHKFKSVPLDRFRGNRFNILFRNAAVVFFLKDHIASFLEFENSNRLLAAVKYDINIPEYVAGCKALGLISELITVPLWTIIENENVHITESKTVYQELVHYLENFTDNCEAFMSGNYKISFSNEDHLNASPIFAALTRDWEHDGLVAVYLQSLVPALCLLCKRLFKDFLHDGIWSDCSDEVQQKTTGVPKHNKFSETIFGHMDRLLREKPNTSQIAVEANMMFIHNKTIKWLDQKSQKEREKIVSEARADVKSLRKKFKQRHVETESKRREILHEKFEKAERTEHAKIQRKEELTNDIQIWSLWQTDQEVDSALSRIPKKTEKRTALTCQLRFRQKVLRQATKDKAVYRLSTKIGNKTSVLSVEELTTNVKSLVKRAYDEVVQSSDSEDQLIIGQKISHAFAEENGAKTWCTGQVISQVII